jgi:phage shock protein PspC (stress-responsive transcriptional regulator)
MKKIININLSGRVLPMEDTAYEKLQAYIESLRRYFANEEGRDEIISDIESRIAELLQDKIRKGATAITDDDVEEVTTSMGRVQDFEAVDAASDDDKKTTEQQQSNYNYSYNKESKRLYRDTNDKMIAGVCSGIAVYLGVDPAIVRILFAIISFGGFGLGFLAYIILWIVLPPRDLENTAGRRLYRNPDDKVISGVAGGLAAYFNKSATTIRLIFAAPFILNIVLGVLSWPFFHEGSIVPNFVFGSITGTFILAYIVLWIVLPEANSDYQKMEMRGERVDVNRIRQNVREGMDNMKERMKGWGEEVKESAQNFSAKAKEFSNTRGKTFASEVGRQAGEAGRGIGHIIGVLFKAFFLFIAGSIAVALFFGLIALLIGGVSFLPLKNFLLDGFWQNLYGWGTLLLFLGVPLIAFIVWLLRRIMKVKSQHNYFGWIFGGLWALGWICVTLFIASLVRDFRMYNKNDNAQELTITQPLNNRMLVKVSEPEVEYSGAFPWINIEGNGFDITQDSLRYSNIRIEVVKEETDSNFHVDINRYSRGRTVADAEAKAQKILFSANYKDSVLDIGSGIAIDKTTKFRGQKVIVVIRVPVGKKIRFDETVDKLHSFTIQVNKKWKKNKYRRWRDDDWDWDKDWFEYDVNTDYIMGEDGNLKNADGTKVESVRSRNRSYEVENDSLENVREKEREKQELQRQLDEEKRNQDRINREKEESEKRQKELQEKLKQSKPAAIKKIRKEKIKDQLAGQPSIQLMEWL